MVQLVGIYLASEETIARDELRFRAKHEQQDLINATECSLPLVPMLGPIPGQIRGVLVALDYRAGWVPRFCASR